MPTLAEVQQQIDAYPHRYIFWTNKEVRALPNILDAGEAIKAITSGYLNGSTWLAVCTNRRVIFLNRGMFLGAQQVQFPLDRIQSINHEYTLFFGSISVWDGATAFTINMVAKPSIGPFVKATEEMMYAQRHTQSKAVPSLSVAEQIAKLAELKEKGYLTDQEFQAQKKKLLG